MSKDGLRDLPMHVAVILDNETCPYCSVELTSENKSKEHVIGRRFVPRGKLDGQWNLILNACRQCNLKKSDLEDDISAITMQPDLEGQHVTDDSALATEAQRKGRRSFSRRSGKRVAESHEEISFTAPFIGGATITVGFVSGPQLDPNRVAQLAHMHFAAFFYWITYDESARRGGFAPGVVFLIQDSRRRDWGNEVHRAFMSLVLDWEPRVIAYGADGYFRLIIRKHPTLVCWSWAIEWNQNVRIVGFAAEQTVIDQLDAQLPQLGGSLVREPSGRIVRQRLEVPLADEDDRLFFWDSGRSTAVVQKAK